MSLPEKIFKLPVIFLNLIRISISAAAGFVTGSIAGWIYYLFLMIINNGKKRIFMSSSLKDKLYRFYPSVDFSKVRIIVNARGIPRGKTAVTQGNYIFFREDFNENNMKDYDLLLHELVHVEQYKKYGKTLFYILYGFQYLNAGFSYHGIELEKEAFDCHRRQSNSATGHG